MTNRSWLGRALVPVLELSFKLGLAVLLASGSVVVSTVPAATPAEAQGPDQEGDESQSDSGARRGQNEKSNKNDREQGNDCSGNQPKNQSQKAGDEGADGRKGGDREKCPPPGPPPKQVSLANLVPPAPAQIDDDLRSALTAVGFIDSWYDSTPTHPALSLVVVTGSLADEARTELLSLIREFDRTTKRSTSLYDLSQVTVLERRSVIEDIAIVESEIADLEAELEHANQVLAGLEEDLAVVIKVLQATAVGLYISDDPAGVSAMDDVDNYNDQQELSIRVDLTVDELLAQRDDLETAIAEQESEIADLERDIAVATGRLAALEGRRLRLSEEISRLSDQVSELTLYRFEVGEAIPGAIELAHQARLMATAPGINVSLVTLDAYVTAAEQIRWSYPQCSISWQLIAGIASIESAHATFGGAWVGNDGQVQGRRIIGPVLDGTLEDTAVIKDTDGGALDGNSKFDAAVGPFQFIPGTWKGYRLDANGDGFADPHNLYDAALSAAGYLCTSSNLDDDAGIRRSVLSYNQSMQYVADVTGNAKHYTLGLALPQPAYDPDAVQVEQGWDIQLSETDQYVELGLLGRTDVDLAATIANTASGLMDDDF